MTALLSDRIVDAMQDLVLDGRKIIGIYIDPAKALQLEREANDRTGDPGHRVELLNADRPTFLGRPLKISHKPGVWAILEEDGDAPTEAQLA